MENLLLNKYKDRSPKDTVALVTEFFEKKGFKIKRQVFETEIGTWTCRIEIFMLTKIIEAYTNLTITDKQKEDIFKFYDQLVASGFAEKVMDNIPIEDYSFIHESVIKTIKNIYKQKNSALGILESISTDYSNLNLDASEIQKKLADPENLGLLKTILTKLG